MNLFRTKPIDQLVAEGADTGKGLKRELTAVDLVALGIGAIIGAGIFATLGTATSGAERSLRRARASSSRSS